MATTTANTILNYKASEVGSYSKVCDIINYPDLGSTPSKLDTTDLTALTFKTSILGLQEVPDLTFEANYDKVVFETIEALTASNYWFQLLFNGIDGAFTWQGQIKVYVNGGAVDEVRKMTIILSASTPIEFE